MPYKPAKKNYRKKRGYRRYLKHKRRTNLRNMITSIVNKNREIKRLFHTVDNGFGINSGSRGAEDFLTFEFPNATGKPQGLVPTLVNIGDAPWERNGNEVTPCYFQFRGLVSVLGESTNANKDQSLIRIVAGFVEENALADTIGNLQLSNGTTTALSNDIFAIQRKFNWMKFRPFYDKTFKLQAPYISAADDTGLQAGSVAVGANGTTSRVINIKHYFGKNPKNQVYPRTPDTVLANKSNIQVLAIVRNAHNVNYHSGQLDVKIVGEGHFSYKDC